MMKRLWLLILVLLAPAAVTPTRAATPPAPEITITDLGTLGTNGASALTTAMQ